MKFDAPKAPSARGAARLRSPVSARAVAKGGGLPDPKGSVGPSSKIVSSPMVVSGRVIGIIPLARSVGHGLTGPDEICDSFDESAARLPTMQRNRKLH